MRERPGQGGDRAGLLRRYRTLIIATAAVLSVTAALIFALPYGIRHFVRQAIVEMGASEALLEDVDFNPFTGRFALHNLKVRAGKATLDVADAEARLRWRSLFKRRIYMELMNLRGARLAAATREDMKMLTAVIAGAGRRNKATPGAGSSWLFGVGELNLTKSRIVYDGPELKGNINIKTLKISGLRGWTREKAASVDFEGLINNGKVSFHGKAAPFSAVPALSGKLKLRGLSIGAFAPLAGPAVSGLKGLLAMDLTVRVALDSAGKMSFTQEGTITIKDLHAAVGDREIRGSEIRWDGRLEPLRSTGRGRFDLKGVSVDRAAIGIRVLELKTLKVQNIELAEGAAHMDSVEARGLRVGVPLAVTADKKEAPVRPFFSATFALAEKAELKWSGDVKVKNLSFGKADLLLRRDTEGRWFMTREVFSGSGKGAFSVGDIKFLTGSSIRFEDEKVGPPYRTTLNIKNAHIRGLDNRTPGRKKTYTLEGNLAKYTKVNLSGEMAPFAKKPVFEIKGDIKNFDLPPLNSYTASSGYIFSSGHMDAILNMKIEKGMIDGVNELVLQNPEFKTSGGLIGDVKKKLGSFPDAVMDLLRDRKNTVSISLPIHGDISDPEFKLNDIVFKAFYGAFMKSGFSYLKYYFQPWGTYITVGQIALKIAGEVARVRLDPVFFEPGSSALKAGDLQYLEKVAGLMKERPRIKVKICGFAVPGEETEGEVSDEALLKLALKRSSLIKDQLVERYGVMPKTLFVCRPDMDRDKDAKPRAELLI